MKNKKLIKVALATVAVLVCMMLGGSFYMYNNGLSGKYSNTEPKEGQIKVACVGDSITYGHGISNWEKNNYPAVLQKILGDEYHVVNFGSPGACVNPDGDQPYIARDVYQESLDYDADILIIMLGTNDSKLENWVDGDTFLNDYFSLLHTYAMEESISKIYLCLCAESYYAEGMDETSGVAKFDIQPGLVDEIAAIQAESMILCGCGCDLSSKVTVVDIHSLTEAHPEWFEADGIHPNADGAKVIAETIAEVIQN